MHKMRGQAAGIWAMVTVALAFVVVMVVLFAGARTGAEMQNQTNATLYPAASTVLTNGLSALVNLSSWQSIVGTISAIGIVIGIILFFFGGAIRGGRGG